MLQIAGLLTVVSGLNRSRELFERESIWTQIASWFSDLRYIIKPPKPKHHTISMATGMAAMTGHGIGVATTTGGTIEERIDRLEQYVKEIRTNLRSMKKEFRRLNAETNRRLDNEITDRKTGDEESKERLEATIIGGIYLEFSGIIYLTVGILLASAPNDVAWILNVTIL